jgi:hypothetical protein
VLKQLGHEGELVQRAVLVERGQNLLRAPDFHDFPGAQPQRLVRFFHRQIG